MGPTIVELNITKTLINTKVVNGETISQVIVKEMILRPIMKRIVFFTDKLGKVIVYDGEVDFEAHKTDSQEALITALLAKIDSDY